VFERLDFVYLPSRDVAADVAHYVDGLGAELVFAIERFETRVAMVAAIEELRERGVASVERFEIPFGPSVEAATSEPDRCLTA